MAKIVKIGNAQGFWGDSPGAPARLAAQQPDLDYLTLDYLAEVSMSILAKQRERDGSAGYARDFVEVVESLAAIWRGGSRMKLISNGGGLNPRGCGEAVAEALRRQGCGGMKIGIVSGDDVLEIIRAAWAAQPAGVLYPHLETGQSIGAVMDRLVTANAYLGAAPVIEALRRGADVVVTGRVADPSLTVAPAAFHFGWTADDYERLAGATIAGHLIECGTQVTGGISTDWLDLDLSREIGYPVVEVAEDGSCVVTKPAGSGGRVNEQTVKEQLVYEIGDPGDYLSPDATVSFLGLRVEDLGDDRVAVSGAEGRAPVGTYKVSATYRAGYRAAGMLTIFGRDAAEKARRCGEMVRLRLRDAGAEPREFRVECIGGGDVAPGVVPGAAGVVTGGTPSALEVVLRIAVADERKEVVERFARELAPLVTSGPQGVTGYAEGRPVVREVFGYWPTVIDRLLVHPWVEMVEV